MEEKTNSENILDKKTEKKKPVNLKLILIISGISLIVLLVICIVSAIVFGLQYRQSPTQTFDKTIGSPKDRLVISVPNGDIEVKGTTTNQITVNLEGKEKIISNLRLQEGDKEARLTYSSISYTFVNFLHLLNPENNKIKGTITVPENLNLELNLDGLSNVRIVSMSSDAKINISGAGDVTFEDSTTSNAEVRISGAGNVTLDQCITKLKVEISGAGSFKARTCTLNNIDLNTSGIGNVTIDDGNIINAKIRLSGAGTIKIPEVRGKLDQDISGAGRVEFLN